MSRIYYEKEAVRILSDTTTYKKLKSNPTESFIKELENILKQATEEGVIESENK